MDASETFDKEALAAGLGTSWQWVDENQQSGDGWAAEGSPMYKWAQYDTPPVPIGGQKQDHETILNPMGFEEEDRIPREFPDHVRAINVPFLGRLIFLQHVQGVIQSSIVVFYWIYGSWSLFSLVLLPHYYEDHMSILLLLWYGVISVLCICSFVKAVTTNPGKIPFSAKKENPLPRDQLEDPEDTQYCIRCSQRRPRLAHHCSVCGQCVRKMDHHCPWINNCVGEENRFMFVQLVMYAFLMSSSALLFLLYDQHMLPKCESLKDQDVFSYRYRSDFIIVSYVLSTLMMLGGGGLFCSQAFMLRFEQTTLDFYKLQFNMRNAGKSPYTHGMPKFQAKRSCRSAYNDYCGTRYLLCYFNPCRKRIPTVPSPKPSHMV